MGSFFSSMASLTLVASSKTGFLPPFYSLLFLFLLPHSLPLPFSPGVAPGRAGLQPASHASVHLRPQVPCYGSAGDHPWEEPGHPAPEAHQQVTLLLFTSPAWHTSLGFSGIWRWGCRMRSAEHPLPHSPLQATILDHCRNMLVPHGWQLGQGSVPFVHINT